jgi:rod shape-determining protein MreC
MLFRFNSYQGSVAFTSANSVAGVIYQGKSNITSFLSLRDVNRELTITNANLQQQVLKLKDQLKKYGVSSYHIEQALREKNYTLIGAQVVQNSVNKSDNLITINRGSADGVKEDMGVVSGNGAVGVVYMVGPHYSVVMPIISVHSSISCEVDGTGYVGYLRWLGGDSHYAYMEDVPLYADIKKNQWVVTSGYSAIFPAGVPIGRIRASEKSPDGVSYRLVVELSSDFVNLRDVCVIDNSHTHGQLQLLQAAKDSLDLIKNQ